MKQPLQPIEITINALSEWQEVAKRLLDYAEKKRIFLFSGEIGAGKTTFIQVLCNELGVVDQVTSPTFSLINEYKRKEKDIIYHMDLYRLKSLEEALDLGLEEILFRGYYCFIEWPEIILPYLEAEEGVIRIQIENIDVSKRKIIFL